MTNYNDGKWHGWNGGECPVHAKTEVNILFSDKSGNVDEVGVTAGQYGWKGFLAPVAFRVVKEYREPREFWSYFDKGVMRWCFSADKAYAESRHYESSMTGSMTHLREVLP